MSIQNAINALTPIATFEFSVMATLPYVALAFVASCFCYLILNSVFGRPRARQEPDDVENGS